ncbi:lactate utilization protein, partial [Archaeoglobales archaeon]
EKYPQTIELAREVREIKKRSIDELKDNIKIAMESLEDNGINVHFAKDGREANKLIYDLIDGNTVVKSKSMTSEEIGLRNFLESNGIEVWETDLGEFIIQILNEKPMHVITPAIHLTKDRIVEVLQKEINSSSYKIQEIVDEVRKFMREKFVSARVGITGANVLSAETGSLILIENEGNIRLTSTLPEKHIAIVGVEKIVYGLSDALKVAEVTWRFAGYKMPSYVDIISTPSKTGDVEKVVINGMHGAKEVHVILLDNGRLKAAENDVLKEALYCLRCGACMYECQVYQNLSGYWGENYVGGIGIVWDYITKGLINENVFCCLLCGRCKEICPVNIDCAKINRWLRGVTFPNLNNNQCNERHYNCSVE